MTSGARGGAAILAGALALAVLTTPVAVATRGERFLVVSYDGTAGQALRGFDVVRDFPHVGVAVVSATAGDTRALRERPGVRAVAPDAEITPAGEPAAGGGVLASKGLGAYAGRRGTGGGVTVAIVDTGVSDTAALDRASGRLVDGVDASGEGSDASDGYGHGTFLATLVAGGPVPGSGGQALGVAPAARVVSVKVAGASGRTSLSRVVAGLDWVAARRDSIDIGMLAFAVTPPGDDYVRDPLTDAVDRVRDAGIPMIVAAGNEPGRLGDPGFSPKVVSVGAADLTADPPSIAPFSGSGVVAGLARPDVHASGVRVLGVLPARSYLGRRYGIAAGALTPGSGTSQATAVVTGVVAAVLGVRPGLTPDQVQGSLRDIAAANGGLLLGGDLTGGTSPAPRPDGSWAASSWSANSWSANSWSANSWSANSWSANSWSANSWSANSWSANSWSANSWSAAPVIASGEPAG